MNGNCNIENLLKKVRKKKTFKIVLMSSAVLFAGNACHTYQKLCGVNTRFRAVTQSNSNVATAEGLYLWWSALSRNKCPLPYREIWLLKHCGDRVTENYFKHKMGKCLVGHSRRRTQLVFLHKNFLGKK